MVDRSHDPRWAVKIARRAFLVLIVLAFVAVGLGVAWFLLPEEPTVFALQLQTKSGFRCGGTEYDGGEVTIGDAELRAAGTVVEAGTGLEGIAAKLYPGLEFRGDIGLEPSMLPSLAEGAQCVLRSSNGWRIARVFVFDIGDGSWLAVPVEFDSVTRPLGFTRCDDHGLHFSWSLTTSFTKRRGEIRHARVIFEEREPPGEDAYTFAPIVITGS